MIEYLGYYLGTLAKLKCLGHNLASLMTHLNFDIKADQCEWSSSHVN